MNLREVSQCPEKAPIVVFSLLKAPASAFTIYNLIVRAFYVVVKLRKSSFTALLRTVSRLDQGRQLGEGGFSDRRLNTATTARRQRRRKHSKPKPKALSNNKITYPSFPHFKPKKLQDILVGKKSGTTL